MLFLRGSVVVAYEAHTNVWPEIATSRSKPSKLLGTRESSFRHNGIRKDRRDGKKEGRFGNQQPSPDAGEGSETIMEASHREDGIVHSFWKQKVKKNLVGPVQFRLPQQALNHIAHKWIAYDNYEEAV